MAALAGTITVAPQPTPVVMTNNILAGTGVVLSGPVTVYGSGAGVVYIDVYPNTGVAFPS